MNGSEDERTTIGRVKFSNFFHTSRAGETASLFKKNRTSPAGLNIANFPTNSNVNDKQVAVYVGSIVGNAEGRKCW